MRTSGSWWSEPSRSADTPDTAIVRRTPTGSAHTTASLSKRSPVAVMTVQPLAATLISVTGVA